MGSLYYHYNQNNKIQHIVLLSHYGSYCKVFDFVRFMRLHNIIRTLVSSFDCLLFSQYFHLLPNMSPELLSEQF